MIKNESFYLDRLAKAETLWKAAEIAKTLERLGTNEAYPAMVTGLARLAKGDTRTPK